MKKISSLLLFLLWSFLPLWGQTLTGQSVTLLPNGQTLLLGGYDASANPVADVWLASPSATPQKLSVSLNFARAGHTATVLPNGKVLVFGGFGANGQLLPSAQSEIFDPTAQQFSVVSDVVAVPRAFHTATVLSDGTIFLAGGVEAGGALPDDIQLLTFHTHKAVSEQAMLIYPRQGHAATLLADGSVRLSGGTDSLGHAVTVDEYYDPVAMRFQQSPASNADDSQPPALATSIPANGATGVSIQAMIAMRFTSVLNVTTVTTANFVLTDSAGNTVSAKVTAVENGRLAFVLPSNPLQLGTAYTLSISGSAAGANGNQVTATTISFTTEGIAPESDGRDWTPNPGWKHESQTDVFEKLPALQAPNGVTALAGRVLKLSGYPLANVTIEINGNKVSTDQTGRFLMENIPAGRQVIWVDGSTANTANASYGSFHVGEDIATGQTTVLNYTIWMTRLDTAHAVKIASPTTQETVITNPAMPGFELRLPANTVIVDRYGQTVQQITITPVPINQPPFPLPPRVDVDIYFTIQPGGAYIRVGQGWNKGGRLIYPNGYHLKHDSYVHFFNYDAEVKGWYIYGAGHVSKDSHSMVPDPGVEIYGFTGAMAGTGPEPISGMPPCGCTQAPGGWSPNPNPWSPLPATVALLTEPDDPDFLGNPNSPSDENEIAFAAEDNGIHAGVFGNPTPALVADPVSLSTGELIEANTDLALPDVIPISLSRTYLSNDYIVGSFGVGSTDNYDMYLIGDMWPYTYQELIQPDGSRVRFDRISPGIGYSDAVYVHATAQDPYYGALLTWNSSSGNWQMVLKDGTTMYFPEASFATNGFCQAPTQITDRDGNTVTLTRTANARTSPTGCNLTQIKSPNGRYINLTHDSSGRITQAQDNGGRTVTYTYDAAGELQTVTDPNGGVTTYTYNTLHQMTSITDPRGNRQATNQYDSTGRVSQQTQADGSTYLFNWTPAASSQAFFLASAGEGGGDGTISVILGEGCWNAGGYSRSNSACSTGFLSLVAEAQTTDPRGYIHDYKFDQAGNTTSETHALGQAEEQTTTYTYYADNLLESMTDALSRITTYGYDANANLTSVTKLSGTSNAITIAYGYEPKFNQLATITDPLNHTTSFGYDQFGKLTSVADPLSHQSTFGYDDSGRLVSTIDALSNTTQFAYSGADLSTVTDPLNNVSTVFTDSIGRVISQIDPMGNTSQIQYNNLGLVSQTTDPQGNITSFTYDKNGNLLTLTDPLSNTTVYTYDTMNRKVTRTDPLNRLESFTYDLNGNFSSRTDRKGQITTFTYDGLNRTKEINLGTSNITYTYDTGNRMTQAVDSISGTITDGYDSLDRLTSETTSQGSVNYGYDTASRRASFQVTGQTALGYTYDNANRLTQIAQGGSIWGFGYDNANRRTALTLPGGSGITVTYGYDNDSRITSITYQYGSTTLGNLTYTYDQDGRRMQTGGAFARTGLPGAVSSATYDAANELTHWNGYSLTYDQNGNMLSDGSNAFTWDARDQVASVNGIAPQYDAFGRRSTNLFGTSFLFDGSNAVQELSGSTVTANSIAGDVDEIYSRNDSSGAAIPLQDANGNVIALVNSSGSIVTLYSYDPFGNTSFSGSTSTNPFQYAGRENELNGLYYYRSRYYSPGISRFISEDTLGFVGGINFYAYVSNDPIDFVDPYGTYGGGRDRGRTARPDGTDNEFKKMTPCDDDPTKVWYKDPNGKKIKKAKPPGFQPWWDSRHPKPVPRPVPTPAPTPDPTPVPNQMRDYSCHYPGESDCIQRYRPWGTPYYTPIPNSVPGYQGSPQVNPEINPEGFGWGDPVFVW